MITQRKPRGNSVLKTLPQARQAVIAEYANAHTLVDTVAWLAQQKVKIGGSALSEWLSSWSWQQQFRLCERDALDFMTLVRKRQPTLSDDQVEAFGNDFFQLQAIKLKDPVLFLKFRDSLNKLKLEKINMDQRAARVRQGEERLKLAREVFQWDAAQACYECLPTLKAIAADDGLSDEEKIDAIRRAVFGELPEDKGHPPLCEQEEEP